MNLLQTTLFFTIFLFLLVILILLYYYFSIQSYNRIDCYQQDSTLPLDFSPTIPKIFHKTWKTKENLPLFFEKCQNSIEQIFPDFQTELYNDNDMMRFMKNFSIRHFDFFEKLPHKIQKVDFFRYCLLYERGGIYCDMDVEMVMQFPKKFLTLDKLIFPIEYISLKKDIPDEEFWHITNLKPIFPFFCIGNYAFMTRPKNSTLYDFIEFIMKQYEKRKSMDLSFQKQVFYTTGPYILTEFYHKHPDKFLLLQPHNFENFWFGNYAIHHVKHSWAKKNEIV